MAALHVRPCAYCLRGDENLCDAPRFTGWHVDGGYAEDLVAPEAFVYPLPTGVTSREAAPFLCTGIIGYRALRRSEIRPGEPLGLYGFGASAHVVIQIARHWSCPVDVCTRGDRHQDLARQMGAQWVGAADALPPEKLRSAIIFAPAGELVPRALEALDKGGTLALAGIYMTPIPGMDYQKYLFQERKSNAASGPTSENNDARRSHRAAGVVSVSQRDQRSTSWRQPAIQALLWAFCSESLSTRASPRLTPETGASHIEFASPACRRWAAFVRARYPFGSSTRTTGVEPAVQSPASARTEVTTPLMGL